MRLWFSLPWHKWMWLVFAFGLAVRLVWASRLPSRVQFGEASNVAIAFAKTGTISDAFFVGQGPTAHLTPTSPVVAGLVFKYFGILTDTSGAILLSWSLLQVFTCYLLAIYIVKYSGGTKTGALICAMILNCVPVFIGQEVLVYRYWDGAFVACLCGATLLLLLKHRYLTKPVHQWIGVATSAFTAALCLFVNPIIGLCLGLSCIFFALKRLTWRQAALGLATGLLTCSATFLPWAARNQAIMGHLIFSRDNFGLEFALANHPNAVSDEVPLQVFSRRIEDIHPFKSKRARNTMQLRGGEVLYNQSLASETKNWVFTHLDSFLWLTGRHISEFYFPRDWQFNYPSSTILSGPRSWLIWLISIMSILQILEGVLHKREEMMYLAPVVVLPGVLYGFFQPFPRYMYPIFPLMVALAAIWLSEWFIKLRKRVGGKSIPEATWRAHA